MFTGIVSGLGRVVSLSKSRRSARLTIDPPRGEKPFVRGESVSVSGVCLTALEPGCRFAADLSPETLARTTLGELREGDAVNFERALRWGDRLSGHFVMGHVDGIACLRTIDEKGRSWTYRFTVPAGLARYVAEKGSVALDGISLTVAACRGGDFEVAVIPETRRKTTLALRRQGDQLNFEADVFSRYGRTAALSRVRRQASRR